MIHLGMDHELVLSPAPVVINRFNLLGMVVLSAVCRILSFACLPGLDFVLSIRIRHIYLP